MEVHRFGDQAADLLRRFDKVCIGEVGVARGGAVPPVPEQLADQGQILAGHDGMTGRRVPKIVQPQAAELRVFADRPPASGEAVRAPAFGVTRKQVRIRVAHTGQRGDMRPRGLAERHGARAGLRIPKADGGLADIAPAQIEHFAAAASGEREQPDRGDGLGSTDFVLVERTPEPAALLPVASAFGSCAEETATETRRVLLNCLREASQNGRLRKILEQFEILPAGGCEPT